MTSSTQMVWFATDRNTQGRGMLITLTARLQTTEPMMTGPERTGPALMCIKGLLCCYF